MSELVMTVPAMLDSMLSYQRGLGALLTYLGSPSTMLTHRRHLASVFINRTYLWAIVVLAAVIGLALLAVTIWAIVTKCGRAKSAPVVPTNSPQKGTGDVERGVQTGGVGESSNAHGGAATPPANQAIPASAARSAPPSQAWTGGDQQQSRGGSVPVPPWLADPKRLPPGIVMAPVTPVSYNPLMSNPRLPGEPPYERLVLVSSRVHNADSVARAVLPNVAYVVYDWKNFTLQELLRYVRKVLGPYKVLSIAVVAPGSKPGTVGLLEGSGTSPDKLSTKTELSQFWRVLSGCVALSGTADGRRIDLLGCRVVEAPREGAALLKELWNLTTVPFAAADDALGGYLLCTFMEEPTSKQLSLICSTIPAIDLYFNRYALLGIPPPDGAGGAVAPETASAGAPPPPLPPGLPPPEAIVPVGPGQQLPAAAAAAPAAPSPAGPASHAAPAPAAARRLEDAPAVRSAPPPQPPLPPPAPVPITPAAAAPASRAVPVPAPSPSLPGQDVFSRLSQALAQRGVTPEAAFAAHDRDRNGQLTTLELTSLMRAYLPDASPMDIKHFQAMLDMDTDQEAEDGLLSLQEFVRGLPENVRIQEAVRAGRDDDEVVVRLQEYLTTNEQILRDNFDQFDANGNGFLDHGELQQLIACIPGLEPVEKKFVMAFLYHHDQNRDMRISLDELRAALAQFASPPPAIAHAVPSQPPPHPLQAQVPAQPTPQQAVQQQPQMQHLATAAVANQGAAPAALPPTPAAALQPAAAPPPAVPPPAVPSPPALTPAASVEAPAAVPHPEAAVLAAPVTPPAEAAAAAAAAAQAAEAQAKAAAEQAQAKAQSAAQEAAAAVQEQAQQAAAGAAQAALEQLPAAPAALPLPRAALAPLGGPLGPPLGGRLAPLAPLGGLPGGAPLARPGALGPLAPLGGRPL